MATDDRTEIRNRAKCRDGAPMNTSTRTIRQRAASSPKGTAMTNFTPTVAILTTLLVFASHSLANDPYGWAATEPHGSAAFARPVAVRVVVYPFAALQDTSAPPGMAQVDPSTRTLLDSAGVDRVEDLPYPMAALVSRSRKDAPVQVEPSTASLSEHARAPRVVVVVYPFEALQSASASNGMAQVDRSTRTLLETAGVARVEDLPYPFAALVSRSHEEAPVPVDAHAAATSGMPRASRIEIFVYPFPETGDEPVAATTTD